MNNGFLCNTGNDTTNNKSPDGSFGSNSISLVIIDHYNSGDCKQVQEVNTNGKSHHKEDENNPFVSTRLVCIMFPFQHHPENKCCKERRQGINFTFNCAIPEAVAKGIGERANYASCHDGENLVTR